MTPEEREQMIVLVNRIAEEKNPAKVTALMDELSTLLGKKVKRMTAGLPPISSASSE